MDNPIELETDKLSQALQADNYVMERLHPRASTAFYLHVADLRKALDPFQTSERIRILDYGCGGSPYRSLFRNSQYVRADFTPCEGLDLLLPEDSSIPEVDCSFDMVLSTQVLEHVPDPTHYVAECFRVLKPGGRLLLTTHGLFEDHGCPYDFHRWTADGLRLLLERAGFKIRAAKKLTCGPRALCFLINQGMSLVSQGIWQLPAPRLSLFGATTRGLHRVWRSRPAWLNRCADQYFKDCSIVDASDSKHTMYIALLMHAERLSLK